MKALSVKQPWAWAIAHGGKDIENRTQMWNYRGPLAIASSLQWDSSGLQDRRIRNAVATQHPDWVGSPIGEQEDHFPRGAIVAVTTLIDVHVADRECCSQWGDNIGGRIGVFDNYRRGSITHLVLGETRALPEPITIRGALGLWNLPAEVIAAIAGQLEHPAIDHASATATAAASIRGMQ